MGPPYLFTSDTVIPEINMNVNNARHFTHALFENGIDLWILLLVYISSLNSQFLNRMISFRLIRIIILLNYKIIGYESHFTFP